MLLPTGSKYPNSRVLGPKIHILKGCGTMKPYYLGTWTLRITTYSDLHIVLGAWGTEFVLADLAPKTPPFLGIRDRGPENHKFLK